MRKVLLLAVLGVCGFACPVQAATMDFDRDHKGSDYSSSNHRDQDDNFKDDKDSGRDNGDHKGSKDFGFNSDDRDHKVSNFSFNDNNSRDRDSKDHKDPKGGSNDWDHGFHGDNGHHDYKVSWSNMDPYGNHHGDDNHDRDHHGSSGWIDDAYFHDDHHGRDHGRSDWHDCGDDIRKAMYDHHHDWHNCDPSDPSGNVVPLPPGFMLFSTALLSLGFLAYRQKRQSI